MKNFVIVSLLLLSTILSGFAFYKSAKSILCTPKKNVEYKGINLVAPRKEIKAETFQELATTNVNAISLIPYAFVNMDNASVVYNNKKQWWGESSAGIIQCIHLAHNNQMKVMLKPHLWVNHKFFTGNLDFTTIKEWENWEADYESYILQYAQIAQDEKVALFCFGTELQNPIAKRPQFWIQLITKIKKIYTGNLTYAANWDEYDKVPFWNQLDYIGVDAYFPISDKQNPSVNDLEKGWQKYLPKMEALQKKENKKILFTEFGYRNSNYAAHEPWTENNSEINNLAQANSYEALFNVFKKQKWYAGGFAWKWYADDYHKRKVIDYTPQEKPALEVIKRNYQ
ncbi:glycoside hydrolase family 113 [Flavobacterium sp.]|uniref:glycoside hydrolase family 113 n=1 Tax=Flavobacterium sp. TaxID=239 RepID=UPI003C57F395